MGFSEQELRWLYAALKQVEFVSLCSVGELETLVNALSRKKFTQGTVIVREGDQGDHLFIIYGGNVVVQAGPGGARQEIARLGPGDYFGEMALVSSEPRSATVVATQDTEAFLLFRDDFRDLLKKNKDLSAKLDRVAARRKADKELELLRKRATPRGFRGFLKRLTGL
jgi:CRP/FNR family transcriptional regulator, cyclic AMP receptor protein